MSNAVKQFIADAELTYSAVYIPQPGLLPDRGPMPKESPMLKWSVTISKGSNSLTTDYHQGIAHIPSYGKMRGCKLSLHNYECIREAFETGRYYRDPFNHARLSKLPAPELADVLYCLLTDVEVIEYPVFEDWAGCIGYDTDSREAERIYRACLETRLKLRKLIDLDAAHEAFQDY